MPGQAVVAVGDGPDASATRKWQPRSSAAGMPNDLSRRLDELAELLDRLPPDHPAVVQALADVANTMHGTVLSRSLLDDERVAAHYELLAARLPADHLLVPQAAFMGRAVRYVQAQLAGDTDRAEAMLVQMTSAADAIPAGHPYRPFVLCGVANAYAERHSLNGDLRNLELAEQYIEEALTEATSSGGAFAPGTQMYGFLLHTRGRVRMVRNVYDPRLPEVAAAIEDLEQALAQVGAEEAARTDLTSVLESARAMHAELTAPSGPGVPLNPVTSTALGQLLNSAETMGRDRLEYPIVVCQAAAGLAMRALSSGDVTFLNQAIDQLAAVSAIPRPRVARAA